MKGSGRVFGRCSLASLTIFFAACGEAREGSLLRDYNVVLIVIDTLRADHLPFHGYTTDTAPFLSDLASRGVTFLRTHSVSSWTAPATASIFTSLYPFRHHVRIGLVASWHHEIPINRIPDEVETVAEVFKNSGYTTFAVSDNVNVAEREGFDQGFHYFRNFHYASASAVNRQVIRWSRPLRSAERFFLYLHYMEPHRPYYRYEGAVRTQLADRSVEAYDAEIRRVDEQIRALYERLDWAKDTLLIVTSNHGEEFGDHDGSGHGHTLYSELIDVPLVFFAGPTGDTAWKPGSVVRERVTPVDILPTLVDLLELSATGEHENGGARREESGASSPRNGARG